MAKNSLPTKNIIWLRNEYRATERRTPLLPDGAKSLIQKGYTVVAERSRKRILADHAYATAGCHMVDSGSWIKAPRDAVILGLKELPSAPDQLNNTHIYFAHAYKKQKGWQTLLSRYTNGKGELLDIEYMTDQNNRRVVAFGFWAGYMGAALALIHWHNQKSGTARYLDHSLLPFNNVALLHDTITKTNLSGKSPRVLIIGAHGRSGKGAFEILQQHGANITRWGRENTKHIDRAVLLDHDILINCAFITDNIPAFLRRQDLMKQTRISVIADVSCDPFSSFNPIPLYHNATTWDTPYITVRGDNGDKKLDIIAIDNLPSLLPREASEEFSAQLLPHLMTLKNRRDDPAWSAARDSFAKAVALMKDDRHQWSAQTAGSPQHQMAKK